MNISLIVPSIACDVCANTITKAIKNLDGEAEVMVNIDTQIVEVNSCKTADMIKGAIASVGHEIQE